MNRLGNTQEPARPQFRQPFNTDAKNEKFSIEDFQRDPMKYRFFTKATIAADVGNGFSIGQRVNIEYFATTHNRAVGGVDMPIYKVFAEGNESVVFPPLFYACAFTDFELGVTKQ